MAPEALLIGTRTLCLTDVVDSTALAGALGATRNAALWDAHDAAARALVAEWRGTELERTDGIGVMFDTLADAVGFAVAYHGVLRSLEPPLVARAGIASTPARSRSARTAPDTSPAAPSASRSTASRSPWSRG